MPQKIMIFGRPGSGKSSFASLIQLTTNKERPNAISFYTKLGFASTHEEMKLSL